MRVWVVWTTSGEPHGRRHFPRTLGHLHFSPFFVCSKLNIPYVMDLDWLRKSNESVRKFTSGHILEAG